MKQGFDVLWCYFRSQAERKRPVGFAPHKRGFGRLCASLGSRLELGPHV